MNKMQVAATVQDWITANWGKDSYDPESDYHNCEALLEKLNRLDKETKHKPDRPWQLLNGAYEQVQIMREIALGRIEEAV